MRDAALAPSRNARDARETLEPMLDDLARGLGYDRAVVLEHDADAGILRGLFGLGIKDDQARGFAISVARATDPIVIALRTGTPQLVDDVTADDRLDLEERDALLRMNV